MKRLSAIDSNSNQIDNVADPTSNQDAATKKYVDDLVGEWGTGVPAPNSITYSGNRSYELVFNSTDLTDTQSLGMKLKFIRTVTAPIQAASLNGTNQYFSKATPAGLTFTSTFTCSAWIKLSSYALGGIIARRNADTAGWSFGVNASGQLTLGAYRIASNNKVGTSRQALPLGKWVHVAASMNVATAGDASTNMYIDGVLVLSSVVTTGTATALVQGTVDLTVGAEKAAGTNPFPGKIAQAAVYSAVITNANINATISQTLSGSETSLVSAFSLSNTLNDLNANANNLTAQGSATTTNADSPFGQDDQGVPSGTIDFGIITKKAFSTNTTLSVQVPGGCTIPTTGGITSVGWSSKASPYGFITDKCRWDIIAVYTTSVSVVSISSLNQWFDLLGRLTVPIGAWTVGYGGTVQASAATSVSHFGAILAPATPVNGVRTNELVSTDLSAVALSQMRNFNKRSSIFLSAATNYLFYGEVIVNSGATTMSIRGDVGLFVIKAENAFVD